MSQEDLVGMANEVEILKKIDHPNIVKMHQVYEDKSHYCIVMDLMEGG